MGPYFYDLKTKKNIEEGGRAAALSVCQLLFITEIESSDVLNYLVSRHSGLQLRPKPVIVGEWYSGFSLTYYRIRTTRYAVLSLKTCHLLPSEHLLS